MLQDYNFTVEKLRFHLTKPDTIVVRGWYRENNPEKRSVVVSMDGEELRYTEKKSTTFPAYRAHGNDELVYEIDLPADWQKKKSLSIVCRDKTEAYPVKKYSVRKLKKYRNILEYYIETENLKEDCVTVVGWAMGHKQVEIEVLAKGGTAIPCEVTRFDRADVRTVYGEAPDDYEAGFRLKFKPGNGKTYKLVFSDGVEKNTYWNSYEQARKGKSRSWITIWQKVKAYYDRNGLKDTLYRVKTKLLRQPDNIYNQWRRLYMLTEGELDIQRKKEFTHGIQFSFVGALGDTPAKYMREMFESLLAQTYARWELCLVSDSQITSEQKSVLERYAGRDNRIRFQVAENGASLNACKNAALEIAEGEYFLFINPEDTLSPDALYECARVLMENTGIDMFYTDEDCVDLSGNTYFAPNFKPDFNPDMLRSMNYVGHLLGVKKSLLKETGIFRDEFADAAEYDFLLRCTEKADNIHHISKALYHRRRDKFDKEADWNVDFSFASGRKALLAHYERLGLPVKVEPGKAEGIYHTIYQWQETPLISLLIPNKDHVDDLKKCVDSVLYKSAYRHFEIIIIENNSVEEKTFAYYEELTGTTYHCDAVCEGVCRTENFPESEIAVRVVTWKGIFNYSAINNFGTEYAKGEYYLLLNNDTEMINPDTLAEMLGYCMRSDVGIVGAKLNYEDDTIQHAGAVVGFGGVAGHTFIGYPREAFGYQGRIACVQNYSAVTAACLMTDRATFEEVGGLTEKLEVAFNDIDYCMKVREKNKLVVYHPYAELYHYESKSRGMEDTPEKMARFNREIATFQERWSEFLMKGDPCFNSNLSLHKSDFALK